MLQVFNSKVFGPQTSGPILINTARLLRVVPQAAAFIRQILSASAMGRAMCSAGGEQVAGGGEGGVGCSAPLQVDGDGEQVVGGGGGDLQPPAAPGVGGGGGGQVAGSSSGGQDLPEVRGLPLMYLEDWSHRHFGKGAPPAISILQVNAGGCGLAQCAQRIACVRCFGLQANWPASCLGNSCTCTHRPRSWC